MSKKNRWPLEGASTGGGSMIGAVPLEVLLLLWLASLTGALAGCTKKKEAGRAGNEEPAGRARSRETAVVQGPSQPAARATCPPVVRISWKTDCDKLVPRSLREKFLPGAVRMPSDRSSMLCNYRSSGSLSVGAECRGGEGPGWLESRKKGFARQKFWVKMSGLGRAAYSTDSGLIKWVPGRFNCTLSISALPSPGTGEPDDVFGERVFELAKAIDANLKPGALGISVVDGCPGAKKPGTSLLRSTSKNVAGSRRRAPDRGPRVVLSTTIGSITLELDAARVPGTVENFLRYVRSGHYAGTIFHRAIRGFLIQGGGFNVDWNEKPTRTRILNEADHGLGNLRGTVAMARLGHPQSAGAQFFINLVDNRKLDHRARTDERWGYCVFGKVVDGMDVVDRIGAVATGAGTWSSDAPLTDVVIKEARVVR